MVKIGIIGYGEIGKSLEELYKDAQITPNIKDLNREDDMLHCTYLHICIPYSDRFVDIVKDYVNQYKPDVVIINSTVKMGTTTELIQAIGKNIFCHSPIRGLHPNLKKGMLTFPMYVGTNSQDIFNTVQRMYKRIQIPQVIHCDKPETTELAKLLDTTYYGLCIAFHKEVKTLCESNNLNFDEVMTEYNKSYNEGYPKLGKPNVVRPVLLDMPGPIGGHCVVPNAEILKTFWNSEVLDLIIKYKK